MTLDKENLYLQLNLQKPLRDSSVGFYLDSPGYEGTSMAFARDSDALLGFNANKLLLWTGGVTVDVYNAGQEGWSLFDLGAGRAMMGEKVMEFSMPLRLLGELSAGDTLKLTLIIEPGANNYPDGGPAQVVLPDLGETMTVLAVQDPVGDDNGPGGYTYPEDAVFKESVFDASSFSVGYDEENLVLNFGFVGPLENPWGSPISLSLQTMDVYIDIDPESSEGARMLLPGRNAALVEGAGWEYVVWTEGWTPQVLQVDPQTGSAVAYSEASSAMKIIVDAAKNEVIIRVPLIFFGETRPEDWAYAAVVLSQEGYPSEGVWRVRDVAPTPAQYQFGGGSVDVNHTRIIDLILPEDAEKDQGAWLSDYPSSKDAIDTLSPNDFPQIPMLHPSEE